MAQHSKESIRRFIETSFLFRESRQGLADDESLLGAGLINSTGILELVSYLEAEFGIVVQDEELCRKTSIPSGRSPSTSTTSELADGF